VNDALLEWYAEHRRGLPSRRTTDPYAILVSEVMLQQTQVARVVSRYEGESVGGLIRWVDTVVRFIPGPVGKVRPKIVNCVGVEQP
jgi:hypothetical protein